MKKVLFLGHSAAAGGAEYCLDITLRFLDRSRVEPFVFLGTEGPMLQRTRAYGIPAETLSMSWWMLYTPGWWDWKNRLKTPFRIRMLTDFIRKNRIDLVYTNTAVIFEGARAARKAGVPHIWHIHEILNDEHMRPRRFSLPQIARQCYDLSRHVIFESEAAKEVTHALLPPGMEAEFQEKTRVVSNSSRFPTDEQSLFDRAGQREKWGISPEKTAVLWIGRFSPRKNPMLMLRAVAGMRLRDSVQVLLVGEGSLEAEMQEFIETENLAETCRILPFQEDLRPILAAGDITVLTSTEESFGLVLVEAGAFGMPLIATRVEGPGFIIEDGQTGFLVDENDACALAERLDCLVENPDLRKSFGHQMCRRVQALFHPETNTRKILDILEETLAEA